jgi:alpha-mannosidase
MHTPSDTASVPTPPAPALLNIYLVPNTHGTVSGWLVDFDTERSHVVNNYSDHMDRIARDPNYTMAFSEVPNLMTLMQFAPERMQQLQDQMLGGRLELVNGFFLEPTINLSGGEALVQMGVLGLRWYDELLGRRPRFAWMNDVCAGHRQMPQIVGGLGLDAIFFSRNGPTDKSTFWWVAPDGTRTLAVCSGRGYAASSEIFKCEEPLTSMQLERLGQFFEEERAVSASQTSIFAPVGGGDYSLAPRLSSYPAALLAAWRQQYPQMNLRFAVPSDYVDALTQEVRESRTILPEHRGDLLPSYNAFWMNMPEIKRRYRQAEHLLQAAEALATAASLQAGSNYPSEPFYHGWLMLLMNMDRNILWGAGAGAPFDDPGHWNADDRFALVEKKAADAMRTAQQTLTVPGDGLAVFNPLNWDRHDPVALTLPVGQRPKGLVCEARGEQVICALRQPSTGLAGLELESGTVPVPQAQTWSDTIETAFHVVTIDRASGTIRSLRDKNTGREFLGGPANVVQAESVDGIVQDAANWMAPRPRRKRVDSSSNHAATCEVWAGPVATTVVARSAFIGGSSLERRIILYRDFPRIDFETTIDLRVHDMVVTVDFPLADTVVQRTRGIPYGFGATDPRNESVPIDYFLAADLKHYGSPSALLPVVRWSDYGFATGGGIALLDRGLTCHELNGSTVTLALLNAQSHYRRRPNVVLAGQGRRTFTYALWPHGGTWQQASIPRHAWEFNTPVFAQPGCTLAPRVSFLQTSANIIVEALRRVGPDIELRFVECEGVAGAAEIQLNLPHRNVRLTNLLGEHEQPQSETDGRVRIPVQPQQIVTLRFATATAVPVPPAIRAWDALVPPGKLPAFRKHSQEHGYPGGEPHSENPSNPS